MKCLKCGAVLNEVRCSICGFEMTSNEFCFAQKLGNEDVLRLTEFIQFADGKGIYKGEYKDGKRHGFGKCTYSYGVYLGEWEEGKKCGIGKFTFTDGRILEGNWQDDKPNGRGKDTYANGNVYEGEFKDGKRDGWGRFTLAGGGGYEGEWKDDKRNGYGKITLPNGTVAQAGEWKNGEYIGSIHKDSDNKNNSSDNKKSSEIKGKKSPVEMLLDQDNNENIVLYDQKNNAVEFEQIAIIPIDDKLYALLRPLNLPGVGEYEALVFGISEVDGEDVLVVVDDNNIVNSVFKKYYALLNDMKYDI